MSMHTLRGSAVIALLAGCGLETEALGQAAEQATNGLPSDDGDNRTYLVVPRCPDSSTNCTQTNGVGIYAQEGGSAGTGRRIGDNKPPPALMITSFINSGASVKFRARYFDLSSPPPQSWQWLTGTVDSADYESRRNLRVTWVNEEHTIPKWTLIERVTGATFTPTDGDLGSLQLHISFVDSSLLPVRMILNFTDAQLVSGENTHADVKGYKMRWRIESEDVTQAQPYCLDAAGHGDRVVFQRRISVDPINGKVERDDRGPPVHVTMSCTLGAIAVAHRWGYEYVAGAADPYYFDAAIQMKRVSYCADGEAYTLAGTRIRIVDNVVINNEGIDHLEARWSPDGAICLNKENMRHRSLGGGSCGDFVVPRCLFPLPLPPSSPGRYLISGSDPPAL